MEALSDTLDLIPTHSVAHAGRLLQSSRFRLIVGTLQFDESRLFDLLPLAKRTGTPIMAVKLHFSILPEDYIARTLKSATYMGFDASVDVQTLQSLIGREAAFQKLRETVLATAKNADS